MIEIAENRVTTGFREARKKLNKNREKIEKLKTEIKEMEELSLGEKKEEADEGLVDQIEIGKLEAKFNYALSLKKLGSFKEAGEVLSEVMEKREKLLGPVHEATLDAKYNYVTTLKSEGRFQ